MYVTSQKYFAAGDTRNQCVGWYEKHNGASFAARVITRARNNQTGREDICSLAFDLREKAEKHRRVVCVLAHDHPSNRTVSSKGRWRGREGDRLFDGWLSRTASGVVWLGRRETSGGLPRGSQTTIILQSRGNTPKDVFILGDVRWKWRICPCNGNSHRNIKGEYPSLDNNNLERYIYIHNRVYVKHICVN